MATQRKNLTGQRFGDLKVLRLERDGSNRSWMCACRCGRQEVRRQSALTTGRSTKCMSCLKKGTSCRKTHGKRNTPEYNTWAGMKGRCLNPNNPKFPRYGGRGIRVDAAWINSFEQFLADMGTRPTLQHSLDRIDNDGDYSPSNCRWAGPCQQANNRHNTTTITLDGTTRTVGEWSRITGIGVQALHARIEDGWPAGEALSRPIGQGKRHPPAEKTCDHCGQSFRLRRRRSNAHTYCSRTCYFQHRYSQSGS